MSNNQQPNQAPKLYRMIVDGKGQQIYLPIEHQRHTDQRGNYFHKFQSCLLQLQCYI